MCKEKLPSKCILFLITLYLFFDVVSPGVVQYSTYSKVSKSGGGSKQEEEVETTTQNDTDVPIGEQSMWYPSVVDPMNEDDDAENATEVKTEGRGINYNKKYFPKYSLSDLSAYTTIDHAKFDKSPSTGEAQDRYNPGQYAFATNGKGQDDHDDHSDHGSSFGGYPPAGPPAAPPPPPPSPVKDSYAFPPNDYSAYAMPAPPPPAPPAAPTGPDTSYGPPDSGPPAPQDDSHDGGDMPPPDHDHHQPSGPDMSYGPADSGPPSAPVMSYAMPPAPSDHGHHHHHGGADIQYSQLGANEFYTPPPGYHDDSAHDHHPAPPPPAPAPPPPPPAAPPMGYSSHSAPGASAPSAPGPSSDIFPSIDHDHLHDHAYDFHHDVEHYHYAPPPPTPAPEIPDQRVNNKYSYYYIGRKLWYIPLFFSIYFIIYIAVLILKSIGRHKIQYPDHYKARDIVDPHLTEHDHDHDHAAYVTHAIDQAARKYER